MEKKGRTSRVVLTPEAKVLKRLRQRHGLSMRKAGDRLGYSDSYISQIENGRENVPTGERLMKFLNLYGGITEKYFKQLCKEWQDEADDIDVLIALLKKLPKEKVKTLLTLAQQMAERKI
jgi:HTH-type transcriptional regulator, competence development regulator